MKFVDGRKAEREIVRLLEKAKWARLAVSYWGSGASERLGLKSLMASKDIEIVCDVRSGGCNVTEVQGLIDDFGKKRVLTRDKLHAKVWLTDLGAVVGSSNASTNGFGVEGKLATGLVEGNLLVEDAPTCKAIQEWYVTKVQSASRTVSSDDLKEGDRKRHKLGFSDGRNATTLLDELAKNPAAYRGRDCYVWIWPFENSTPDARERVAQEADKRHLRGLKFWEDVDDNDILPGGSFVLEFDSTTKTPRFQAIFRVLDRRRVLRHKGSNLLLCLKQRTLLGAPLGDENVWRKAASVAVRNHRGREWEGTLDAFASRFLLS